MKMSIRFLLALCFLGLVAAPLAHAAKPDKKAAAESAEKKTMTPQQKKDLEAAKERAKGILIKGGFTEAEAKASFKALFGYGYREIAIRTAIRKLKDDKSKREYRKNFGASAEQARTELLAEAGPDAVAKFDAVLAAEQAERAAKSAAAKQSSGK